MKGHREGSILAEEGGVTVVMLAGMALFLFLLLGAADIGSLVLCKSRAQDAADATALAAVQESFPLFTSGGTPEVVAKEAAGSNGAQLERFKSSISGDHVDVCVSVRLPSLLLGRMGAIPDTIRAASAAEVDMEALLADGKLWSKKDAAAIAALLRAHGSAADGELSSLVVSLSLSHLGKPYVWGATGPDAFDCSGLVCYVYSKIGIHLPRVTFSQVRIGKAVNSAELKPGDLVFFRRNAHVGIYIGAGRYVHAPRTGDVVKVSELAARSDISACRRIF